MATGTKDGVVAEAPWSDALEALHEEGSRDHFLDVWTRRSMLDMVGTRDPRPTIVDIGCSTGYLLEDLQRAVPEGRLIGLDFVMAGLRKANLTLKGPLLAQADCCRLPFGDGTVDVVVSANMLEHIVDDQAALTEIGRVLRPGGRAVVVVPSGPKLYDYYDRFLHHQRRYGRGELAVKARSVGLEVMDDACLGWAIYPLFWIVKKRNRMRLDHLHGDALERQVAQDIAHTKTSRIGRVACRLEAWILSRGVRIQRGVRRLTVLERPKEGAV